VTPVLNHLLARPGSPLVIARQYLSLHIRADGSAESAQPVDVGSVERPLLVRAVDVALDADVLLGTVLALSERVGRRTTRHAVGQAADALRRRRPTIVYVRGGTITASLGRPGPR